MQPTPYAIHSFCLRDAVDSRFSCITGYSITPQRSRAPRTSRPESVIPGASFSKLCAMAMSLALPHRLSETNISVHINIRRRSLRLLIACPFISRNVAIRRSLRERRCDSSQPSFRGAWLSQPYIHILTTQSDANSDGILHRVHNADSCERSTNVA